MTPPPALADLLARRDRLREQLAQVGDFRPGSLSAVMRRCGKPNCACAAEGHPGHGPQHMLTRKAGGKTVTTHLREGPELAKARTEVANYQRFKHLVAELIEVNEAICRAKPVSALAEESAPGGAGPEKRGSATRSPSRWAGHSRPKSTG